MRYFGYHRTSTKEQHLDRGIAEIKTFCKNNNYPLKKIYCDQCSGKTFDRPRYTVLKEDVLDAEDILIVTELDRLGRDKDTTLQELKYFKDKNIRVMVLELPTTLIDFSIMDNNMSKVMLETINNMMIELYASIAQAELEKKRKRQREGIETKKLRGEWEDYGRPRKMSVNEFGKHFDNVLQGNMKPFELMKKLNLKQSTFYKYRNEYLKIRNAP